MTEVSLSGLELFAAGVERLRLAGVGHPAREGRWIWQTVCGEPGLRIFVDDHGTAPAAATQFDRAIARRAAGEPLAHVLGSTEFRHLTLVSDRRALIPRPETEGLVAVALRCHPTGTVLDVGTGTGCVALSLAQEGHYNLVVGLEYSAPAMQLTRLNVELSDLPVLLLRGDLCASIGESRFDILVSNPPYVSDLEYDGLDPEVRDWEPEAALRSGPDGLTATRRLLADGIRVVRPGGWIVLELDSARAGQTAEAAGAAGWSDVTVQDDLFGRARYLRARRSEGR